MPSQIYLYLAQLCSLMPKGVSTGYKRSGSRTTNSEFPKLYGDCTSRRQRETETERERERKRRYGIAIYNTAVMISGHVPMHFNTFFLVVIAHLLHLFACRAPW